MKIKKIMPESFVIINFVTYFRLENGALAVGDHWPTYVRVDTSRQDSVELITLDRYQKTVQFWKINDRFYSLNLSSYIEISDQITFVDYYFPNDYSDEVYIKYFDAEKRYGIISVSEKEIFQSIPSKKGFTEISFENNVFYAKDGENKYHIIDDKFKELGIFPTKCKIVPGFSIFYDNNKIYADSSEVTIPNGIQTLEIVTRNSLLLLRISNENGIYFYSKSLEYILGPIKNDKVIYDLHGLLSCFIYETIDEIITKVFYVEEKRMGNGTSCICKKLSCKDGIEQYYNMEYFFVGGNTLYHFDRRNLEFLPILNDADVDSYSIVYNAQKMEALIVAHRHEKPCYIVKYFPTEQKLLKNSMEYICNGFEKNTYICKDTKNNVIFVIKLEEKPLHSPSIRHGIEIFHCSGINCNKIKILSSMFDFLPDTCSIEVYSVEVEKGIFKLFSSNGEVLLFRK